MKKLMTQKLLHPAQLKVYQNRTRFTVVLGGRRFGKTRLAIYILITESIKKVGVYWWIVPVRDVGRPAWRQLKKFVLRIYPESKINDTLKVIEIPNGSIIELKSADNPDSLKGEGLSGVVIDECAQVKEGTWTESIRPALADKQGWALFIGTPKGKNWFYHLYMQADKLDSWSRFTFTTYDNPFILRSEIDDARKSMSDREFRQEHLAEFVSDEGTIFKKEWFNLRYKPIKVIETFISWDTASSISNTAAYTSGIVGNIDSNYKLHIAEVFRERLEFPQLQYKIEMLAKKYLANLRYIVIENKSSGISVIQSLRQTTDSEISRLIYSYNPKGSKIERGYEASKWAELGMIILPEYEDNAWLIPFEDELFSFPDSEYKDQVDAFSMLVDFSSNYLQQGLKN